MPAQIRFGRVLPMTTATRRLGGMAGTSFFIVRVANQNSWCHELSQVSIEAMADLDLVDGLVQLSFAIGSVLSRIADREGLSLTQLRMLAVLQDREIGMLALARILELEKSSVTGLVDRAERRGLVRRVPVAGNRRAVHVTVTEAGGALARSVRDIVRAEVTALAAPLSAPQQDRLSRSVAVLIEQYAASHAIPL
jgi:DNA-binding MarR family transcriptional regulator